MLSRKQVRELADEGLISFGGHTRHHTILAKLPANERSTEIRSSIDDLADLTDRPAGTFAYPNGGPTDWGTPDVAVLREAGLSAAVTTIPGANAASTPPFELRRHGIGAGIDMDRFRLMVHSTSLAL